MPLLSVWSLRRVLLAGPAGDMLRTLESLLCFVGSKPLHASIPFSAESLSSMLLHRASCIIVPDLLMLDTNPQTRLDALNTLLFEAREAGTPLVMLLSQMNTAADGETAQLFSHALSFSRGGCGDPVNIQCIRHDGRNVQRICRDALKLGARFLSGETQVTGVFTLEKR